MTHPVVLEICKTRGISADDFFGPLKSQVLAASRCEVIGILRDRGLSKAVCARIVRRNVSTVHYWLNPVIRSHRLASMRTRKARRYLTRGRPRKGLQVAA
jgi:hypothetical protein